MTAPSSLHGSMHGNAAVLCAMGRWTSRTRSRGNSIGLIGPGQFHEAAVQMIDTSVVRVRPRAGFNPGGLPSLSPGALAQRGQPFGAPALMDLWQKRAQTGLGNFAAKRRNCAR